MATDDYPSRSSPLQEFVAYFRKKGPSSVYAEAREREEGRFRKELAEWRKHTVLRPLAALARGATLSELLDPAPVTEWDLIKISAQFVMEDCLSYAVRLRAEDHEPSEARQLFNSQIRRNLDFIYEEAWKPLSAGLGALEYWRILEGIVSSEESRQRFYQFLSNGDVTRQTPADFVSEWQKKNRSKRTTPSSDPQMDAAVLNVKENNPSWSGGRIANDLQRQGIDIDRRRVNRILKRAREKSGSPTGR